MCYPPRLTEFDISEALNYAKEVQQTEPGKFEYARQILQTYLPLHESITETVKGIITQYPTDCPLRILFIGVGKIMEEQ